MKRIKLILLLIVIGFSACEKQVETDDSKCDSLAIIDSDRYNDDYANSYKISNATYNGTCLTITVEASGCDGDTWVATLVDSGEVKNRSGPQRNIRLVLENTELCLAYITKEITFDIDALIGDNEKMTFDLKEYNNTIYINY